MTDDKLKSDLKILLAKCKVFGVKSQQVQDYIDNHPDPDFQAIAQMALFFRTKEEREA